VIENTHIHNNTQTDNIPLRWYFGPVVPKIFGDLCRQELFWAFFGAVLGSQLQRYIGDAGQGGCGGGTRQVQVMLRTRLEHFGILRAPK
jgi:hypothetical protein